MCYNYVLEQKPQEMYMRIEGKIEGIGKFVFEGTPALKVAHDDLIHVAGDDVPTIVGTEASEILARFIKILGEAILAQGKGMRSLSLTRDMVKHLEIVTALSNVSPSRPTDVASWIRDTRNRQTRKK